MNILFGVPETHPIFDEEIPFASRLSATLGRIGVQTDTFLAESGGKSFAAAAGKARPRIVHAINALKGGLFFQPLIRDSRLPFIVTCIGEDLMGDTMLPEIRARVQNCLASADVIITPSIGVSVLLKDFIPGIPRTKVIPKGIFIRNRPGLPPLERFGLSLKDDIVLLPGKVLPRNNTLFAVKNFLEVSGKFPCARLVVLGPLGKTVYGEMVEAAAKDHPEVLFADAQSLVEVAQWNYVAKIIISVSHAEFGSQPLLEGMGQGAAIIAPEFPGIRNYVINEWERPGEGTGLLYSTAPAPDPSQRIHDSEDFKVKLERLLKDDFLRIDLGRKGFEWVRGNLNPDLEAFNHFELYNELGV